MLPLLPLVASLAPSLIKLIAGDSAGEVAGQVAQAATTLFGSDEPETIEAAIAQDPGKALEFKARLLDIQDRESERRFQERLKEIEDKGPARTTFANSKGVLVLGMVQVVGYIGVVAAVVWGAFLVLSGSASLAGKDPGTVAVVTGIVSAAVTQLGNMAMQPNSFFYGASHEAVAGVKSFAASIAKMGGGK